MAAAAAGAKAATLAAAALAAAPEVDAEPRFRRSRSRAGSVCAVDDAIGSIRIDDDEEEVGEFGRERSLGAGSDAASDEAANQRGLAAQPS